jgi:glycosyltransferase involved in cell wall biosynthesis
LKANIILTSIEDLLSSKKINIDNTLFYAYWNDDKALALSLLKLKNPNSICICRAHRWEIEYEKQTPKYLPFKKLIFDTLNKVYTISEDGMNSLINLLGNKYASKIEVSRLGKKNNRKPIFEKTNSDFVICSCSIMIPRKRLKLVIEILSKLKTKNITWVHFGDGSERKFLEEYIKEIANHITIDFKGIVPNKYILDFYASNYVDLFINVSESEGIPVSIMEAQSASIPILATNVGGLSEIIDIENGFLIDKDIDIYNTAKIIDDYLMSSEDNKIFKRKKSHQNWLAKYDANVNYLMFNNKNKIL